MRVLDSPLWPQPGIPWALQLGAIALWCALAACVLLGLAFVLPYPWSEVGWASFPPAGIAALLGLVALLAAPPRQKALGLAGLTAAGAFVLALRLS